MMLPYFLTFVLLLLGCLSLWVIIQNRTAPLITFVLVPLLVFSIGFSWYAINEVKGYAVRVHPHEESILIFGASMKPHIYLLVMGEEEPRLHRIPWTEQAEKRLARAMKNIQEGQPMIIGREERDDTSDSEIEFYEFDIRERMPKEE